MEELGKVTKSKYVSLETKAKVIHTLVYPVTMYRLESWTVKEADRGKIGSFEIWCWKRDCSDPGWTAREMNTWALELRKPNTPLEAKVTKLKPPHFGHIIRR